MTEINKIVVVLIYILRAQCLILQIKTNVNTFVPVILIFLSYLVGEGIASTLI